MNSQTLSWPRPERTSECRASMRRGALGVFGRYSLVVFLFLAGVTVLTWGRWTVVAFPLDAGREMIVPQMLLEGHALYTDIRCFYGPLGYWLNAGLTALFGDYANGFWLVNLLRFAGMLVLLWLLAWRLLSPMVALLAITAGVFTLFFSFAVPYTAAIGWGAVFLVGGILCAARPFSTQGSVPRVYPDTGVAPASRRCASNRRGRRYRISGLNLRTNPGILGHGGSRGDFTLPVWSVASAILLALATATKHEYTAAAVVVWVILLLDLFLRHEHAPRRRMSIIGAILGFILPVGLLAAFLLATVPWHILIRENLWLENLLQHHTATGDYTLWSICTPFNLLNMLSWLGLLMAGVSGTLLALRWRPLPKSGGTWTRRGIWPLGIRSEVSERRFRAAVEQRRDARREPLGRTAGTAPIDTDAHRRDAGATPIDAGITAFSGRTLSIGLLVGLSVTFLIEIHLHRSGLMPRHGLIGFRQFRPREWIEALPVLCLPLAGLFAIHLFGGVWKRGPRRAWQKLGTRGRLLAVCVAVYMIFAGREVPGGIALARQPLGTILLAALLSVFLPRLLPGPAAFRRMARATTAILLLGLTFCAIDAIAYLQSRPAGTLRGRNGLMHVYQRRQPFTPQWFQAGLDVIDAHETQLADRTIACVPEGAWINAVAGLAWPMRDTQWMPFCQDWIAEDLDRAPPDFLLVMKPERIAELTRIEPMIDALYIPIDTNAMGMTLYQLRPENRNREPFSEHRESIP